MCMNIHYALNWHVGKILLRRALDKVVKLFIIFICCSRMFLYLAQNVNKYTSSSADDEKNNGFLIQT